MARLEHCIERGRLEAGCDEAGRGCLAGPVVAAAVILPGRVRLPGLDDSKKMSEVAREDLRPLIEERALAWCVASASPDEIDELNILRASFLAMHRAIAGLRLMPEHLLIDGNRFERHARYAHTCIVGGDGRFRSIAAASVLAKTHRDALMRELHATHSGYGWAGNKGYPTVAHREAIRMLGPSDHHRRSFALLPRQLQPL